MLGRPAMNVVVYRDPGPSEGPESTDPAGRSDLDAYPRPSLAVDVAVMSVVPAALVVETDICTAEPTAPPA